MYLPVIRKAIGVLEEKAFYQIATLYLEGLGYTGLSVIDGPGDGGRDVISDRNDLVIQLSVRKDWENKVNDEAARAKSQGLKHIVYITNRAISQSAEQDFLTSKYKFAGDVDASIHDLNRISTSLSRPGSLSKTHEILHLEIPKEISADPKEVALSSMLLFSSEAKELRRELIDVNVKSIIRQKGRIAEEQLVAEASKALPWAVADRLVESSISRLRGEGKIFGKKTDISLSEKESEKMDVAEKNLLSARVIDIRSIKSELGLEEGAAEKLLNLGIEILLRSGEFNASGVREEELRHFISQHNLSRRRAKVYKCLAKCETTKFKQYGETLDHICKSNTFDIYRALGRRTDLTVLLDASVAMPILCGLSFGHARSRYGAAASALVKACKSHGIKLAVPKSYLNEMAFHGKKALDFQPVHQALPDVARSSLTGSGNAYLSHYTHIAEIEREQGRQLSLLAFLKHFGIMNGANIQKIENKIESLLNGFGISIVRDGNYDDEIFKQIAHEKRNDPLVLIEHDARVCTYIKEHDDAGYIMTTWDRVVIDVVEGLSRVYADNPARVIDFLSISNGVNVDDDTNYQLLTSLIHVDERKSEALSKAIERLKTAEQGYQVQMLVDLARSTNGQDWELSPEDIYPLLDESAEGQVSDSN